MSENAKRAGVLALICSFLFPLVGVICYFVKRKVVENSETYLYSAGGGFLLGTFLQYALA